jgi:tRNA pseudouridine13 synthase
MEMYSTDSPGIGGRLKDRFEDFLVEEITPERETLQLQDMELEQEHLEVSGEKKKFVSFVVQKMGLSTMDVSTIIASELRIPQHLVTYAGLKDKRAVTAQMMSIPRGAASKLSEMRLARIRISNPRFTKHPVQVGDLWGNRFTILLTNIEADCDTALKTTDALTNQPLLNYFGVQRFGVTRPVTHLVGKQLIKKDYEAAARHLLTDTTPYESAELTDARTQLAEDFIPTPEIIEEFPKDLRYEREMLRQLIKHPGDFKRAFSKVRSRVLTIFTHSFQSYLFNRLISMRAKEGLDLEIPEPGDFLIQLDSPHSGRDSWSYVTEATLEARIEEVRSGKYGLAAPLLGYATKMPPSKQTEMVKFLLEEESVSLQDFRNKEHKALDSGGGFHLVSIRPMNLHSECSEEGLNLSFSLRKGSYATVVLREVMKSHPINRV